MTSSKTLLVTGVSSGFGRALAQEALWAGHRVVGTPSGNISVEHVRNVLARLSDPQRPPPADTALALREAPRADTHRYDRLRAADAQEARHAH